ncbi:MAG: hypothetical protein ACK5Y6_06985 [Pseudomonadota bacterium]|jgi:hypothetical protein
MNYYLKQLIICALVGCILCCVLRQRRYWRELRVSRPSGTLRAGYHLAVFSIVGALLAACWFNTENFWQLFLGIVLTAALFAVKITFSPTVIAVILGLSTLQFMRTETFPFFEVWGYFINIFAWRLPEGVRVTYATISFVWVLLTLLRASDYGTKPTSTADVIENMGDGVGVA